MDILTSWTTSMNLYLTTVWPKFGSSGILTLNFWHNYLDKIWIWTENQGFVTQCVLVILVLTAFFAIVSSSYVRLTKGYCNSKTKLDGKVVLITGANSGIAHNYTMLQKLTKCEVRARPIIHEFTCHSILREINIGKIRIQKLPFLKS